MRWALVPLALFWLVVVMAVALAARAYCYHHEDLGIYTQALAQLSWHDLNPFLSGRQLRVFNDHVDPILVLGAPLAHVMPPWRAALLVEAIFVSAAAVPLVWLARAWSLKPWLVALLSALLLLEPAVVQAVRFPVHPTTWAMAPMMFVVACLLLERWRLLAIALLLLFACKEEFPFCGALLGVLLWRRTRLVLAVSVGWVALAFALRPLVLGDTSGYGASLVAGFLEAPAARFTTSRLRHGLFDFVVPFAPLVVWCVWKRRPFNVSLFALAVPLLAIRFLGMAWAFHYLAPLVPLAVGLVAFALRDAERPPWWLVAAPLVALAGFDAGTVRFLITRTGASHLAGPRFCPADPERLHALDSAVAAIDGPSLVSANLFAQLAPRTDVYAVGGFQPDGIPIRYVLIEKGELGDPYPLLRTQVAAVIDEARTQASRIMVDDARLFFAEGDFVSRCTRGCADDSRPRGAP